MAAGHSHLEGLTPRHLVQDLAQVGGPVRQRQWLLEQSQQPVGTPACGAGWHEVALHGDHSQPVQHLVMYEGVHSRGLLLHGP